MAKSKMSFFGELLCLVLIWAVGIAILCSCDVDYGNEKETFYTPYAGKTEVYGNTKIQFPDYNDMFDDSCVMVVMSEKGISAINKKYELSYFGNCQLESIEDLTYITGDINDKPSLNKEDFQQILKLTLLNKSKQSVVDTLYELRTVSGIQWAGPNYYHTFD